jgi:hypothetical protein
MLMIITNSDINWIKIRINNMNKRRKNKKKQNKFDNNE